MCQCSALSALSFNTRHTWVNEWSQPRLDQGLGKKKTVLEGSQRSLLAILRPFWCIHAELCSYTCSADLGAGHKRKHVMVF